MIVPCFNEEEVIRETYQRLKKVKDGSGFSFFELIFINDGSKDGTLEILKEIAGYDQEIKVISFSRNFGHQTAVSAGIHYCSGDAAVIIDADLQDPPELIPELISLWKQEQCDVVYGVRKERKGDSIFKKVTAKLFYRMIDFLSEVPIPLDTGDFRLINQNVIREFKKLKERNKYIRGLISWIGFKQIPFYYSRDPRLAGETKYPLSKMIKFAATGLTYFTKKPLKLAMALGFISIIISLSLAVYVFIEKLALNNAVSGWASTVLVILFLGGVQLLTLGVIGEYLGNIFDEIKQRPEYIVAETINMQE